MRPLLIIAALILGTACAAETAPQKAAPTTVATNPPTFTTFPPPTTTTTIYVPATIPSRWKTELENCGRTLADCFPDTRPSVDDSWQTNRRIRELERKLERQETERHLAELESRYR